MSDPLARYSEDRLLDELATLELALREATAKTPPEALDAIKASLKAKRQALCDLRKARK